MIPIRDVIPSRTTPVVTISLIVLNVLVFLFQSSLSERGLELFLINFALVPAEFSIVTVFTAMFLHAGLAHLAGNMLFLWIFGDNIEDRLGHGRFVWFYVICGVCRRVRADRAQSRLAGADGRGERRHRRRDGRVPDPVPALAHRDAVSVPADRVRAAGGVVPGDVVRDPVPERPRHAAGVRRAASCRAAWRSGPT